MTEVASIAPRVDSAVAESAERSDADRGLSPRNAPRAASALPGSVPTDRSGTYRSVPPQTLSARFWGADLAHDLPRVLSRDGVQALRGEIGRVGEFLKQTFPTFTEEELGADLSPRMIEAKGHYLRTASDLIELQHLGRTVGVLVGAPEDWSSFYVRILAFLPEYQRPALTRRFVRECLFEPLAARGVERIVAETWPTNIAMTRGFTEMQFHVTGHQLSERWGALVRYTKFLDPAREAAFEKRFAGALPSRKDPGRRTR